MQAGKVIGSVIVIIVVIIIVVDTNIAKSSDLGTWAGCKEEHQQMFSPDSRQGDMHK